MPTRHSGPSCQYPGKDRNNTTTVCLTPEARRMLEADAERLGRSKADHIEHLIRREHARIDRQHAAAATT